MTARKSLTLLEEEGLVYRDGKRGTFIAESRIALRVGSFSSEVEKLGRFPGAEVVWAEYRQATPAIAGGLSLKEGEPVAAIRRLRKVNDIPIALETSYYPEHLVPGLLDGDLLGSLWREIEKRYAIKVFSTIARLEVIVLSEDESKLLTVRNGAHGIQLTRTSEDTDGHRVEYAVDIYRADRVSLIIDREID